jgi:hypothetical protein
MDDERTARLRESQRNMKKIRLGIYEGAQMFVGASRSATERIAVIKTGVDDPRGYGKKCFAMRVAKGRPGGKTKGSCKHITATHLLRSYTFVQSELDEDWIADVAWNSSLGRPILNELTRAKAAAEAVAQAALPLEDKKPLPVIPLLNHPPKEIEVYINGCKVKGAVEAVRALLPPGKSGV